MGYYKEIWPHSEYLKKRKSFSGGGNDVVDTQGFILPEHGVRIVKDAITRDILKAFNRETIEVASSTFEIVGVPPVKMINLGSEKHSN